MAVLNVAEDGTELTRSTAVTNRHVESEAGTAKRNELTKPNGRRQSNKPGERRRRDRTNNETQATREIAASTKIAAVEITNVNKPLTTNSAKQVATMEMTALNRSTYRELSPDPESVVPGVVCESKTLTLNMQTPERIRSTQEQPGPSPLVSRYSGESPCRFPA